MCWDDISGKGQLLTDGASELVGEGHVYECVDEHTGPSYTAGVKGAVGRILPPASQLTLPLK